MYLHVANLLNRQRAVRHADVQLHGCLLHGLRALVEQREDGVDGEGRLAGQTFLRTERNSKGERASARGEGEIHTLPHTHPPTRPRTSDEVSRGSATARSSISRRAEVRSSSDMSLERAHMSLASSGTSP